MAVGGSASCAGASDRRPWVDRSCGEVRGCPSSSDRPSCGWAGVGAGAGWDCACAAGPCCLGENR